MHAVFLDQKTFSDSILFDEINEQVTQLITYSTTSADDVISRCKHADIVITNKVEFNADTLQKLPQLKLICIAATGTNNVDLVATEKMGIVVKNATGYSNHSVSQYIFSQLLRHFQQIEHHIKNTEQGLWQKSDTFCHLGNNIHEISGKTLGLIGYGNLGRCVEKIALAFDMKVLIAEREQEHEVRPGRTDFETVLKSADIISLHCPHTPETENMVNEIFFKQMKKSAVLINTARGAVVDNIALANALKKHQISAAILDVLDQEPPPSDHVLLQRDIPNLTLTAHVAWASIEAQQRLISIIAGNIQQFIQRSSIDKNQLR